MMTSDDSNMNETGFQVAKPRAFDGFYMCEFSARNLELKTC